MKNFLKVTFLSISAILFFACSKDEDGANEPSTPKYEFLVAGINTGEKNPSTLSAMFFNSNELVTLPQEGTLNRANEVLKIGNDVYVGGIQFNAAGQDKLGYWKNSVFTTITQTDQGLNYGGLAIVNGNIYMAASINNKVKVWKNGVEVPTFSELSANGSNAEVYDLYVTSNEQVYICGTVERLDNSSNTMVNHGFIGKLGETLSIGFPSQLPLNIVYGSTTYAVGIDYSGSWNKAYLWQNTVPIALTASSRVSTANKVAEIEGSVYVLGETHDPFTGGYVPLYWIDREVNQLPVPAGKGAEAIDIQQVDGHIFILGRLIGDNGFEQPIIWKDGEIVETPAALNAIKYANAFQVVKK